ncbi:MAG: flavodoxin family protein [Prevotellaceae bacterium]|nr:flavodoxin family protein [Prevotellaceae bacterium]
MKIVILKGSPRKSGNSNLLADFFAKGAAETGHEVFEFDCTRHKVGGCLGCNACGMNGPCVQKDDFGLVRDKLVEADAIVFATPIYYFGMSGQLKSVIDRFYSIHDCMGRKKAVLIATMGNPDVRVSEPATLMYDKMVNYLGWEDCGRLLAAKVWSVGDVERTPYVDKAYEMGKSL